MPEDLRQLQATEDFTDVPDSRIQPSGSSRRPFKGKYAKFRPTMGIYAIEHRPIAAQLVGRCVAYWTIVETALARLLSKLLYANSDAAIAMYLSLRNSRAKSDAMHSVADVVLAEKDRDLFRALIAYKEEVEKQRNDLAHGVIGVCRSVPNGIVWMSTADFAIYQVYAEANGVSDELWEKKFKSSCSVYELGDLETLARDIENINTQIGAFIGYLGSTNSTWRASRYQELCNEPRVKEALRRIRQSQRSK